MVFALPTTTECRNKVQIYNTRALLRPCINLHFMWKTYFELTLQKVTRALHRGTFKYQQMSAPFTYFLGTYFVTRLNHTESILHWSSSIL